MKNYFCRFCCTKKVDTHIQTTEITNSLRKEIDYNAHLDELSFGIKENIFNSLPNFHIYKNVACDVMHDLFQGIQRYVMARIIQSLLYPNYFSLELLNSRIKYFNYDLSEKNIPPIRGTYY